MSLEGWLLAGVVLTGGLAAVFIPLMRGRGKKAKGRGDDAASGMPFMIAGGGRGDKNGGDGGGDAGGDGGGDGLAATSFMIDRDSRGDGSGGDSGRDGGGD